MAEFAALASIMQLTDVCFRAALSIDRLVARLRHAPKTIRNAQEQLATITRIVEPFQNERVSQQNLPSSTFLDLNRCLEDCYKPIEVL